MLVSLAIRISGSVRRAATNDAQKQTTTGTNVPTQMRLDRGEVSTNEDSN